MTYGFMARKIRARASGRMGPRNSCGHVNGAVVARPEFGLAHRRHQHEVWVRAEQSSATSRLRVGLSGLGDRSFAGGSTVSEAGR